MYNEVGDKMQRYFAREKHETTFRLNDDDLYHITVVMRMKPGDEIEVVYNQSVYLCCIENVNKEVLASLLEKASLEQVPEDEFREFRSDLKRAETLVYLTDNCGEIVLDKLFIRHLKKEFPRLQITAMVRGSDVLNDATMEDAEATGLTALVPCIGNGSSAPGTVLKNLSSDARRLLLDADMIIAKGQGNFESLYGEGLNPYYFFLCKCELFVQRFGLKQFAPVFAREDRIFRMN